MLIWADNSKIKVLSYLILCRFKDKIIVLMHENDIIKRPEFQKLRSQYIPIQNQLNSTHNEYQPDLVPDGTTSNITTEMTHDDIEIPIVSSRMRTLSGQ